MKLKYFFLSLILISSCFLFGSQKEVILKNIEALKSHKFRIQKKAFQEINRLSCEEKQRKEICRSGVVSVLASFFVRKKPRLQKMSMALLTTLSYDSLENQKIICQSGILHYFIKRIKSFKDQRRIEALIFFKKFSLRSENHKGFIKNGLPPVLLELLRNKKSPLEIKLSLSILKNLTKNNFEIQDNFRQLGLIELLQPLRSLGSSDIEELASDLLDNLDAWVPELKKGKSKEICIIL